MALNLGMQLEIVPHVLVSHKTMDVLLDVISISYADVRILACHKNLKGVQW